MLYHTHSGGIDYTGLPGQVTFAAGSGPGSQFSIDLTIIDDDQCEDQEGITAQLSASAPGQLIVGQDQCTIFINDNDGKLLYTCMHDLYNMIFSCLPVCLMLICNFNYCILQLGTENVYTANTC